MATTLFTPIFNHFKNLTKNTLNVDVDSHMGYWADLAKRSSISEMEQQFNQLLEQTAEGLSKVNNPATFQTVTDFLASIGQLDPSIAEQVKNVQEINDQNTKNTELANLLSSWSVKNLFTQGMMRYLQHEAQARQAASKKRSSSDRAADNLTKFSEEIGGNVSALADRAIYEPGTLLFKFLFNMLTLIRDMIHSEMGLEVPERTADMGDPMSKMPADIRTQLQGGALPGAPKAK